MLKRLQLFNIGKCQHLDSSIPKTILNRTNNIFELVTVEPILNEKPPSEYRGPELVLSDEMEVSEDRNLRLKGQMIYMDNWKMMMYLGTPVMPDLNSLINSGLYINDLSMHDFSRDLMLAGTQQSVELKLALDQEQQKSKKLEESMRKLDDEMKRTDELLYQMIPKQVADRLRKGENPIDTCEMFESVSILFSDVVTFTEICSRITPMEVVSMLNGMYSIFDKLTERNRVYKVETIGDAYMVVSGAPEKEGNHAERVCDMALDMVDAITDLKDPSTGQHLCIRVGVHSGAVVAGIVGLKMPRYCLFGDSVNTASRMESTSEAMKIHISQYTKELIPASYRVMERGEIQIKGKGTMKTYWLQAKECRVPVPRNTDATFPSNEIERIPDFKEVAQKTSQPKEAGRAAVYSPITFQDVARRSIANSPIKSNSRELRSNSAGAVYSTCDPTDLFGSIILEQHEVTDRVYPSMNLPCNFINRCTTAPPRTNHFMFNKHEVCLIPQGIPLASSPAILNNKLENHISHTNKEKKVVIDSSLVSMNIQKERTLTKPQIQYEFGKSMYNYAKRLENKSDINHREVAISKSDGHLYGKNHLYNGSPSQQVKSTYFKHQQHQQCCTGFGSSTRTRHQSNACIIV